MFGCMICDTASPLIAIADGISLVVIGKLLGHALAETTERYAHLADEAIADAAQVAYPARWRVAWGSRHDPADTGAHRRGRACDRPRVREGLRRQGASP
jgi:hypothetical protein